MQIHALFWFEQQLAEYLRVRDNIFAAMGMSLRVGED